MFFCFFHLLISNAREFNVFCLHLGAGLLLHIVLLGQPDYEIRIINEENNYIFGMFKKKMYCGQQISLHCNVIGS